MNSVSDEKAFQSLNLMEMTLQAEKGKYSCILISRLDSLRITDSTLKPLDKVAKVPVIKYRDDKEFKLLATKLKLSKTSWIHWRFPLNLEFH